MAKVLDVVINLAKKGTGAKDAANELNGLADTIKTATAALSGMALIGAAKATYELAELGAQSLRTKRAFENISGGSEKAAANLDAMRRATRGAVSETQMMAQANRLLQMGLVSNAQEMEKFVGMAVQLGSAMGKDATAAIEEFSLMIANQSIPRLDTFGISGGRVRTRIIELQKETKGLTREQAFLIAVQEEGTKAMERLGEAAEDEALAFEKASARSEDMRIALGEGLAPAVSDITILFLKGINEGLYFAEMLEVTSLKIMGWSDAAIQAHMENDSLLRGMRDTAAAAADATPPVDNLGSELGDVGEAGHEAASGIDDAGDSAEAAYVHFQALGTSAQELGGAFLSGVPTGEDMYKLMIDTGRAAGMSTEELAALSVSMGGANEAAVQAQLGMYTLIDAYEAGVIPAESLGWAAQHLDEAQRLEAESAQLTADGQQKAAAAAAQQAQDEWAAYYALVSATAEIMASKDAAEKATPKIEAYARAGRNTANSYSDAASAIRDFNSAMAASQGAYGAAPGASAGGGALPPGTSGPGGVSEFQGGGMIPPGGWGLVGETGMPELVQGPARVIGVRETSRVINNMQNQSRTINVSDRLALRLAMEQAYYTDIDNQTNWF